MRKKISWFFGLSLLVILTFSAKGQRYSLYQNINTSNGLPSNYVFGVAEDTNGFLWVATDKGLCRFDGFKWQVWDKDNTLPGNYVTTVYSDKKGGLWLGISEKGYYHFDTKDATLQKINIPGIISSSSTEISKEGSLYLESTIKASGEVNAYLVEPHLVAKPAVIYSLKPGLQIRLKTNAFSKKIYCISTNENSVEKIARAISARWPVIITQLPKDVLYNKAVYHISDSVLITNNTFLKYTAGGKDIFRHNIFSALNSYAFSFATSEGYYVYNIKTGYYFINNNGEKAFFDSKSGLGTDYVNHIFQASDKSVIISTLGAGLQILKNNYRKSFATDNKIVRSILFSGKQWYLLAGDKIYKTTGTDFALSELGNAGNSSLTFFKSGDTILTGSLKGISFFKETKTLALLGFVDCNAGISSIIRSGNGFMAGTYGNGIAHFSQGNIILEQTFPFRIVEKLQSIKGGVAALSYEDGLILTDTINSSVIHLTLKNGLLSNSIYYIAVNNDTIWIATKGGLSIFSQGKVVRQIHLPAGYRDSKIIYFFADKRNRQWAVSDRYLYRVIENQLKPVASHPLIAAEDFLISAVYNGNTDELAVGSEKSFAIININAIVPDTFVSRARLLDIISDGRKMDRAGFTLPYDFSNLNFSFAPLVASPFTQNRFFYKLEGRDTIWREVKDSLDINFSALRPGLYTLFTKTINTDGFESRALQMIRFKVQKPFWLRWPFFILCILVTAATTILLMRQLEKAKKRKREMQLQLTNTIQVERERISRDLHDHLGTNLATIIAQADNIETRLYKGEMDKAADTLQNLSAHTRETMNVLRETIWAVQESEHALTEFILRITAFLQRFFESTNIGWEVKNYTNTDIILSPSQTLHLFRIIQEASQNILKHSGGDKTHYHFFLNEKYLEVVIKDNGQGYIEKQNNISNGLSNIRERIKTLNGTVQFHSEEGTTITLLIPL